MKEKKPRVVMPARVKPSVAKEISRLAKRAEETESSYIARILEAHANGKSFCPICADSHNFHHADHVS